METFEELFADYMKAAYGGSVREDDPATAAQYEQLRDAFFGGGLAGRVASDTSAAMSGHLQALVRRWKQRERVQ